MRVSTQIDVSAPPELIWEWVSDPERALRFMHGITRWELASDRSEGIGTRYRILMRVGSAEIGSLVEVVEWQEAREIAWTSVTGLDQRARWRLRPRDLDPRHPRTHVEFRMAYGVAGAGLLGWVAERVGAPQVRRHLRRSAEQLKRHVEHEQRRREAEARRAARSAA